MVVVEVHSVSNFVIGIGCLDGGRDVCVDKFAFTMCRERTCSILFDIFTGKKHKKHHRFWRFTITVFLKVLHLKS